MKDMDGARRVGGLLWVAVGLGFQVVWFILGRGTPGVVTLLLVAVVSALALVMLGRGDRWTWFVGWMAAVLLGLDFAGAVADRLGLFGPPGAPGVSWGTWSAFVADTARLLPGLDRSLVETAAVTATAVEVGLGVLLLSGWQRRWVGKATAGLLLVYLVATARALGLDAVAVYGLPILVGGALLISSSPARPPARPRPVDALSPRPSPNGVLA